MSKLRNYLLTGIVVTAPVGITLYLAYLIIDYIDSKVVPLLPAEYNPSTYLPFAVPGIGLLLMLVVFVIVGFLAAGFVGRALMGLGERVVARMPVVRSIYGALKQIFEAVLAQSSQSFREVVLVEYPRRGIWALGFITGTTKGEVQNSTEDDVVNVFLPTTPNPTSGFLLFVPRRDLVKMHMTVEDGIKMVISAGIVTPPDPRPAEVQARPVIVSREGDAAPEPPVLVHPDNR
ncbi:MAG: hypothetical protein CMM50_00470 [Rhodospirillaceae bacterium]|nr:hypothetical protein [Rhodospirillaceae bacterium]